MTSDIVEQVVDDLMNIVPQLQKMAIKPFNKLTRPIMSPMQIHVLFRLYKQGEVSMSELAGSMNILKQQLHFLTDKLEENKFIVRTPDRSDKRLVKVSITQQGIDFLDECRHTMISLLTEKLLLLPPEEIVELKDALACIRRILSNY